MKDREYSALRWLLFSSGILLSDYALSYPGTHFNLLIYPFSHFPIFILVIILFIIPN